MENQTPRSWVPRTGCDSSDTKLEEIKNCFKDLKDKEHIYIQNQELCQELGKQKERANFLDQVLQNAKLEIQNRDCLIEKFIKENEKLEKDLENVCYQTQNTPKLKDLIRENENYKRDIECCQNVVRHLQEKYEWSKQCTEEKETFIENLEKKHAHTMEKMCAELQQFRDDNKRLEEQIREGQFCIQKLQGDKEHFNEKYEIVCRKLKERTAELESIKSNFDKYKKSVEVIKDFVMKNKNTAAQNNCRKSIEKREVECPKKDNHARERWKQSKHSNGPRDDCSNDDNITVQNQTFDTSPTRRAKINRSREKFNRTYMNARKRISEKMGNVNNNRNNVSCTADGGGNQSDNYSAEREFSRGLPDLNNPPEPIKKCDNARICKAKPGRCLSDTSIMYLLPDVYKSNGNTRAKSTFKSGSRMPDYYRSPPAMFNQTPISITYQMPQPQPAAPFRVSQSKEIFVGTKMSDTYKALCSPYQPVRVAVSHTTHTDDLTNSVDVKTGSFEPYQARNNNIDQIKARPSELYQARSNNVDQMKAAGSFELYQARGYTVDRTMAVLSEQFEARNISEQYRAHINEVDRNKAASSEQYQARNKEVDQIKARSPEFYQPLSNKYQEMTKGGKYDENYGVSQVEIETKVDNLSASKMASLQNFVQQVRDKTKSIKEAQALKNKEAELMAKETHKKKFKFF